MTANGFINLALQSVTAPRDVARLLLSVRLGAEALLTAFAAVVVLNGVVFGLSSVLFAGSDGLGLLTSPLVFALMQGTTLAVTILMVTWAGRGLGGQGGYAGIAVLMIWLQALRVLAQTAILLLLPLSPFLGSVAVLGASALGVWIAVHFIDEAHEFGSLLKALGVLILGVVGMAIALSIVLSVAGVSPQGMTGYV